MEDALIPLPISVLQMHDDGLIEDHGDLDVTQLPALFASFLIEEDEASPEQSRPARENGYSQGNPFWDVYMSDPDGDEAYIHVGVVSSFNDIGALHYAAKQAVELDCVLPGHVLFIACRVKSLGAARLYVTAVSKDYELLA